MIKGKNINFSYKNKKVLNGVDIQINKGEIVSIIGKNGSGKTTLLKIVAKLMSCERESLTLYGENYETINGKDFAKSVGYFPQSRHTPDLTVKELLENSRYPHNGASYKIIDNDVKMIEKGINLANIQDFYQKSVKKLSSGERQKVYLGALIAQGTEFLLLDEPTNYLDIKSKFTLMDNLLTLKNEGCGVVVVMHDLVLSLKYSDRIYILDGGKVCGEGTPNEIIENGIIEDVFGVDVSKVNINGKIEYVIADKI